MTPTAYFAAVLTALAPVVGNTPTWVRWTYTTPPAWMRRDSVGWQGPHWELFVTVKDGDRWRFWTPASSLPADGIAGMPPWWPGEQIASFEREWRAGQLRWISEDGDVVVPR